MGNLFEGHNGDMSCLVKNHRYYYLDKLFLNIIIMLGWMKRLVKACVGPGWLDVILSEMTSSSGKSSLHCGKAP